MEMRGCGDVGKLSGKDYEFKWNRKCRHLLYLHRGLSPDRHQGRILSVGKVLAVISGSGSGCTGSKPGSERSVPVPGIWNLRLFLLLEYQGTFRAAETGGERMVSEESERETVEGTCAGVTEELY